MINLDEINETTASKYKRPLLALLAFLAVGIAVMPLMWAMDKSTETARMEARAAEYIATLFPDLSRQIDDVNALLLLLAGETGEKLRVDPATHIAGIADLVSSPEIINLIKMDNAIDTNPTLRRELRMRAEAYNEAATEEIKRLLYLVSDDADIFEPNPAVLAHPLGGVYREALALRFQNAGYNEIASDIRAMANEQLTWRDIQTAAAAMHPRAAGMSPEQLESAAKAYFKVDISGAADAARRSKIDAVIFAANGVK